MKKNRFASRKPLKFEIAPSDILDRFEDLAREFFSRFLEFGYDDCLVTDESCLCDFTPDEAPDEVMRRFVREFGFELPKGKHTLIADIVREIAKRRREEQVN